MTDDSEVTRIAAALTKAQCEAVLGKRRLDSGPGMWPLRNALHRLNLVEGFGANPTPLWHKVRSYLQSKGGDA